MELWASALPLDARANATPRLSVTATIALWRARETCFGRMHASLLHFGAVNWSGLSRPQNSAHDSTGVIGSHRTSREPCDFSNNFGAGHLPFLGSQPRPTGYETRTERLPARNSHVCASLLTSELEHSEKNARRSRACRKKQNLCNTQE